MGRWSRHPMGSDGAYDARDMFFRELDKKIENGEFGENAEYYFDLTPDEIQEYLNSLSLDDLRRLTDEHCISNDRFVVPYIFKEYCVKPKNDEIHDFLIECFDYRYDIDGGVDISFEEAEENNILELCHIKKFIDNFDAVFDGTFDLPDDPGLLATIFNLENIV